MQISWRKFRYWYFMIGGLTGMMLAAGGIFSRVYMLALGLHFNAAGYLILAFYLFGLVFSGYVFHVRNQYRESPGDTGGEPGSSPGRMYELSGKDTGINTGIDTGIDTGKVTGKYTGKFTYPCFLLASIACLAMIYLFVAGRCEAIAMPGYDCGIGIGWFDLAGVFFIIGAVSAREMYRAMRARITDRN